MNIPTPLNDTTRDERFDRGLTQLLDGDPAGLDRIDPDLQDIAVHMVQLANDAGWIGTEPGDQSVATTPRWRDWHLVSNVLAAVAVIGIVAALAYAGIQYLPNQRNGQYGSQPPGTNVPLISGPGVCVRPARTDAEIAAIVRKSEEAVQPYQADGVEDSPEFAVVQATRDWNSCLQQGLYDRATAYESEYFIWLVGKTVLPSNTGNLADRAIAREVIAFHEQIQPIATEDGLNLSLWQMDSVIVDNRDDRYFIQGVTAWLPPIDERGDWLYWPTVVSIEWDGYQWVIISTSQNGVPEGQYKPDDNNDVPPATP